MLSRRPNPVRRLLICEVNIDRLLVSTTDEIEALVNGIFGIGLGSPHNQESESHPRRRNAWSAIRSSFVWKSHLHDPDKDQSTKDHYSNEKQRGNSRMDDL